jgi:outer membrane murein-binding lipoprotein Lpp
MSLGMAERQSRARRRVFWGLLKGLAAFALVGVVMAAAYKTGNSVADIDIRRLNDQIAQLTAQKQALQSEASGLRAQTAQAQQQVKAWEQRYKADMPSGDSKALLDLANRKLSEGADVARITALISAASNPRVCDDKPETKHLQVKTPIGKVGKEATAVFADRKVTVTADGEPALDGKGQKLSWFDPAQPITLHFAPLEGQPVDASGMVPLQHQMIVGSSEFRFSVEVDERKGFATITGTRCNFP